MFKRIAERTDRKTHALKNAQHATLKIREVVQRFLHETVGAPEGTLRGVRYTPDRDIVVSVSTKSAASSVVLRMTELRADLRAAGIHVRRVVPR